MGFILLTISFNAISALALVLAEVIVLKLARSLLGDIAN